MPTLINSYSLSSIIGIGTNTPNENLTVVGNISASGIVYESNGNSNQWNSTYTTVCANSTQWASTIDSTKLALSGGTLTGGITGTTALFSGEVYGSTATAGTNNTQLATTAFVQDNLTTGLSSGSAVASIVVAHVTNADSVPLERGNVVYSYGSQGDRVSVRLASASADNTSAKTLGFVNETIAVGQTGHVTLYGSMDKLDLGSPFVAGDALWLGTTPGTYTRIKPVAPTHMVSLGVVQRANAGNGTAYIKIQNGYELDELHDVLITNPTSSQILQRNSENTLWVNRTPLSTLVQIFSSEGDFMWNKAPNAKLIHVMLIGGGGGGGGGAKNLPGQVCSGGGAGAGGGFWEGMFDATLVSDSVLVTVGSGGLGGLGASAIGSGANGSSGTLTKFDGYAQVTGGVRGTGGSIAAAAGGAGGTYDGNSGGSGGLGASGSGGTQTNRGGAGGGGGGGVSSAPGAFNGGVGGFGAAGLVPGGTIGLGSSTASGQNGGNGTYSIIIIGSSVSSAGGGGGASTFSTGNGGDGGNGGGFGTGGGGGGATVGSGTAGKGGDGTKGLAVITTYF